MKLKNKVAVITGGNSGIGLAMAKEFTKQGASVAICGRNIKSLDEAVKQIDNATLSVQADVSKLADLENLFAQTSKRFGKIDVLVANAGIARFIPIENMSEEAFNEISDINFKGAYFTVQKALPHLSDNASIILVSSVLGSKGMVATSVYSATKAALRSMARTLSAELVGKGIRVNVLSPGPIETPIYGKLGLSTEELDGIAKDINEGIPLKRFGSADEMAQAALFLASSMSSYVVGSELVADGGFGQV
ncbi:3-oxoacyl-[acyl-carrier protein] reductase [hydrothermal vent metagenome]|uniref:3-oxoacyl-[acyl-carrier protein] reductase n=1 Tax=hydrothermal vent metagenome TaxID=652676 RepID=A0A3B1C2F1_9ZZZZ